MTFTHTDKTSIEKSRQAIAIGEIAPVDASGLLSSTVRSKATGGVCTNRASHRVGLLTFEHQGCQHFELDEDAQADWEREFVVACFTAQG